MNAPFFTPSEKTPFLEAGMEAGNRELWQPDPIEQLRCAEILLKGPIPYGLRRELRYFAERGQ